MLRKTRRDPKVGDIFAMLPPDGQFLYGRVISTDANPLVPPLMTNKRPWTMGYFEHLKEAPLTALDRLPQHCFKDVRGWYFDESGRQLPRPVEPVGQWGLHSFRSIDDEISKALGIALAPPEA